MTAQNTESPRRSRIRLAFLIVPLAVILLIFGGLLLSRHLKQAQDPRSPSPSPATKTVPRPVTAFSEDFATPSLDSSRWAITSEGDFEERVVDVVGSRLRL